MKYLLFVLAAVIVSYSVFRSSYRPQEFRAQSPPTQASAQPQPSAQPNVQQPSAPADPDQVQARPCPNLSEAAYNRVMRAREYRNLSHEAHGDLAGGVWRATGDDCTALVIYFADHPDEEQRVVLINTMLDDLCAYGFKTINVDGFPTTLPCETQSPAKKHKPRHHP